jgi:hypothetical protein
MAKKIAIIFLSIISYAVFLHFFGFQILNRIYYTGSAPLPDADQRLIAFVVIMFIASIIMLKDWIKKK